MLFPRRTARRRSGAGSRFRICRFEQMESRQLLSVTIAPIHVATTYFEDSNDFDQSSVLKGTNTQVADLFEVSFTGGADGTQLTQLRIDTDEHVLRHGRRRHRASTAPSRLTIVSHDGFEITSSSVVNGGTQLVLTFSGFRRATSSSSASTSTRTATCSPTPWSKAPSSKERR